MVARKMLAAYFTSWIVVLWVSFPSLNVGGATWRVVGTYTSWAFIIALYAVPSIFVYGILVSSLVELAAKKLKLAGFMEWAVSGCIHVILGFSFGLIFQSSLFSIMGGAAAVLFFSIDMMIPQTLPLFRWRKYVTLITAPLLLFGVIVSALYLSAPPKPPFTPNDAVSFATSGSGSTIDWFPKRVGITKRQIEGYEVERETAVVETGVKEQYLVYFIESWRKGEEVGEHRMIYEVTRGTMGAKGSEGTEPPYQRSS
ncbi:hypothetical protein [Paenibacillus agricola]|uniref:Uncharacterized protein n=1 Tax=Paenibacillus agricola TaxID=2716264 RepID=A0ABX0J9S6_9BACL|nr:hypothetical protein [Paenibacillus agricola]NHN32140.1 hypothetical protein [Paenibacillus agricola]